MTTSEAESETLTERQQYWQAHLKQCEASGQSLRAYADEHGLKISTLYFYRKRLRRGEVKPTSQPKTRRFIRAQPATATLPCRVHLRNGVTAEFGVDGTHTACLLEGECLIHCS